jgi:hypothetical protein
MATNYGNLNTPERQRVVDVLASIERHIGTAHNQLHRLPANWRDIYGRGRWNLDYLQGIIDRLEIIQQHLACEYLFAIPDSPPAEGVVAHNNVRPTARRGFGRGFRAWIAHAAPERLNLVPCSCSWAPHLGTHYRVRNAAQDSGAVALSEDDLERGG